MTKKLMKLKDWQRRALKTFIQAFLGMFVPEITMLLSGNLPTTLEGWKMVLVPAFCSALAAGISAAWNIILEYLKGEEDEDHTV